VKFYTLSGAEKCGCHKQIWLALEVLLSTGELTCGIPCSHCLWHGWCDKLDHNVY